MDTNTQEQGNVTVPKRRGRPPRNQSKSVQSTTQLEVFPSTNTTDNNEELTLLKSQLQQLQQENLKLKQIAETVTITNTKPLINCTDDEINSLYVNYITTHETAHDNALVIEADGKVIIPKSYYVVG
jgi:hypothetical protein